MEGDWRKEWRLEVNRRRESRGKENWGMKETEGKLGSDVTEEIINKEENIKAKWRKEII